MRENEADLVVADAAQICQPVVDQDLTAPQIVGVYLVVLEHSQLVAEVLSLLTGVDQFVENLPDAQVQIGTVFLAEPLGQVVLAKFAYQAFGFSSPPTDSGKVEELLPRIVLRCG